MSKSRANDRHSQSSEWIDDFASEQGGSPRSDTPAVVPKTRPALSPLEGPAPIRVYLNDSEGLDAFAVDPSEDAEPADVTTPTALPHSRVSSRTATTGTERRPGAETPTVSASAWLGNTPLRFSNPPPQSSRFETRRRSGLD